MNRKQIINLIPIIAAALVVSLFAIPHAHAESPFTIHPVYEVLSKTDSGIGKIVADVWRMAINLVDSLVILVLIAVAFANILRYQLDSYAVKKFLPTFIMAVILANFSFLISRIIIDFGNMAISLFIFGNTQNNVSGAFDQLIKCDATNQMGCVPLPGSSANYYGAIMVYIVKQWVVIAGAVLIFILSFIFMVRNYFIYFLVALAPIAFMAMVLPATKKYFQTWWSNFTKWVFMPVVSVFWLWIAGMFLGAIAVGGSWVLPVVFACLCYYMAITSPFKVGGAVMGAWANYGKKGLGFGGKQIAGAGARTSEWGQRLEKRYPATHWKAKTGKALNIAGGVINVPAMGRAVKEGRAARMADLKKAEAKTSTFAGLGGQNVRIEAMRAKNEDELKFSTPKIAADEVTNLESSIMGQVNDRSVTSTQKQKMVEHLMKMTGAKTDAEWVAKSEIERRDALRRILASDGVSNLLLKYKGLGGQLKDENAAVLAEGHARNFIQFARGRTRIELGNEYRAASGHEVYQGAAGGRGGGGRRPSSAVAGERPVATGPEAVTVKNMEDFTGALHDMIGQLGLKGQVGENDLSNFTNAIAKMKPGEISSDSVGLMLAKIGVLNTRLVEVDPAAMTKLTNSAKIVARENQRWEAALQVKSSEVMNRALRIMSNKANPETVRAEAEEGIGLIGTEKEE